ncbi:MAG: HAD family hydrolase [Nanoarchaeota archaeon]
MIKSVIFDVDGVLLDSFEANLRFFQDLMRKTGYRPPTREEYPALFHLSMLQVIRVLTKSSDEDEVKKIWKMGKSRSVGYHLELLKHPDGMEDVIQELSKTYTLAIVTSRVKGTVFEASRLAKLKRYFKVTITYEDTINHKPHPEPLLLAAKKLKVSPARAVYIGDVENDVLAARAAGMKVITYSRKKFRGANAGTHLFRKLPALISRL